MSLLSSISAIAYGRRWGRYAKSFVIGVHSFLWIERCLSSLEAYPDWKLIVQIVAAHICYLVAEANFEPHSDSARLCLIGADHWKFPRTYASPEAIQVFQLLLSFYFFSYKISKDPLSCTFSIN